MSVPNRLYNSTDAIKYIIDAEELNENFEALSDGSGLNDGCVTPNKIAVDGVTSPYYFTSAVKVGVTNGYMPLEEGMIFCKRDETTGESSFVGVTKNGSGNLQYVILG